MSCDAQLGDSRNARAVEMSGNSQGEIHPAGELSRVTNVRGKLFGDFFPGEFSWDYAGEWSV